MSTKNKKMPEYTFEDVVEIANDGSVVQKRKPIMSEYDKYMAEATDIYNRGVEENKKMADNQSAIAHAQFNEINRNVNEINKASGKANTGYAGDVSIDAYNSYRNAVNSAYSEANRNNNELYSYYLNEMRNLQQLKNEELLNERAYSDQKETNVLAEITSFLNQEGAYDSNGRITNDTANKIDNYLSMIYGNERPVGIQAYLDSQNGYSEWQGNKEGYTNAYESFTPKYKGFIEGKTVRSDDGDNITVKYNGEKYKLEVKTPNLSETDYNKVDNALSKTHGEMIKWNGKLYVRSKDGKVMEVTDRKGKEGTLAELMENV